MFSAAVTTTSHVRARSSATTIRTSGCVSPVIARKPGQRVYSDDDNDVRLTVSDDEAHLRIPGEADYQDCERT
jgi:hypothetical protein